MEGVALARRNVGRQHIRVVSNPVELLMLRTEVFFVEKPQDRVLFNFTRVEPLEPARAVRWSVDNQFNCGDAATGGLFNLGLKACQFL